MKRWWMTFLLCLSLSVDANAAATVQGNTGLIDTPTADVVRQGQFFMGYYHLKESSAYSFGAAAAKNLEVGIGVLDGEGDDRKTLYNAKYALLQEGVLTPGLAVGIEDVGGKEERTPYVVVSKGLPWGVRVHAGYGGGRFDGAFYGLEKSLLRAVPGVFPDTALLVEYNGQKTNYGLRMSVAAGLKINAGRCNGETYVGVTYNFY